jgi:hypothetical protein
MLRISLFGPPNRRKQPERYVQFSTDYLQENESMVQKNMEQTEIIYREIISESGGIWYISDETGSKILLKIPSTTIKAIIKQCKVYLLFGKEIRKNLYYLNIGIKINDFEEMPFSVISTCKNDFEQNAIQNIFKLRSIYVEIFNELDICIAKSMIVINPDKRNTLLQFIDMNKPYYKSNNELTSSDAELSLNNFQYSLDEKIKSSNLKKIEVLLIQIYFNDLKIVKSTFLGYNQQAKIAFDSTDEGNLLENIALAPLQSLFDNNVYMNPLIMHKHGTRELTDVFAYYEKACFVIESKSLSILNSNDNDIIHHTEKIKKHIKKAIKQLLGAKRVLENNIKVYDSKTKNEIHVLGKDNPLHCIVLVENIYPVGNWDEIIKIAFESIGDGNVFLNILELSEYLKLIKYSRGKIELFDYNLIERCKLFVQTKSLYINCVWKSS